MANTPLHTPTKNAYRWNLYRMAPGGEITPVCPMRAEFGLPPWTLGLRTFAPLPRAATGGRRLLLVGFSDPASPGASLGESLDQ